MIRPLLVLMMALSFTLPGYAKSLDKSSDTLEGMACYKSRLTDREDLQGYPHFYVFKNDENQFVAYSPNYNFIDTKITDGPNEIGLRHPDDPAYRSKYLQVSVGKPSAQTLQYFLRDKTLKGSIVADDFGYDLSKATEISVAGERGIVLDVFNWKFPFSNVLVVKKADSDTYSAFMTLNGSFYMKTHVCRGR